MKANAATTKGFAGDAEADGSDWLTQYAGTSGTGQGSRPAGAITAKSLLNLLGWQGYRASTETTDEVLPVCALTGLCMEPADVALDHINPKSKGGGDTLDNVHWVHAIVNSMKGTMGHDEFIEWCRLVARHADTHK